MFRQIYSEFNPCIVSKSCPSFLGIKHPVQTWWTTGKQLFKQHIGTELYRRWPNHRFSPRQTKSVGTEECLWNREVCIDVNNQINKRLPMQGIKRTKYNLRKHSVLQCTIKKRRTGRRIAGNPIHMKDLYYETQHSNFEFYKLTRGYTELRSVLGSLHHYRTHGAEND